MGKDRMERWGHHEARGASVVRGDDRPICVRIPLQEPRQALGLNIHRGRARRPNQDGLDAAIRAEDRVGPIPSFNVLEPDPEETGRTTLLAPLRAWSIRLLPAHVVSGLTSM